MATVSTNLRKGMAIKYKGDSGLLLEVEHRTPGKGAGFVQVIMRSFASGKSKDIKFAASEKVDIVNVDPKPVSTTDPVPEVPIFVTPVTSISPPLVIVTIPSELVSSATTN